MNDHEKRSFEEEWPHLAEDCAQVLQRRGAPPWLVDEVLQETGIKLWKMWDEVDPARSVGGLSVTIAVNELNDHWRGRARREVPAEVPDRAAPADVEQESFSRMQLRAVGRALRRLQPSYRNVLLAEVGLAENEPDLGTGAVRMLRMRARRELATLLDSAAGFGVVVTGRITGLWHRVLTRLTTRMRSTELEAVVWGTAALVIATSAGGLLSGSAFGHQIDGGAATRGIAAYQAPVLSAGVAPTIADGVSAVGALGRRTTNEARKIIRDVHRPLAKSRLGRMGEVEAWAGIETGGLRAGTARDGSFEAGCADGSGTSELGDCKIGEGKTRGRAEVRYRFGDKKGRVRVPIGNR